MRFTTHFIGVCVAIALAICAMAAPPALANDNGIGAKGCDTGITYEADLTAGGTATGGTNLVTDLAISGDRSKASWSYNNQLDPIMGNCDAFVTLSNGQTVNEVDTGYGTYSAPAGLKIVSIKVLAADEQDSNPAGSSCGNGYNQYYTGGISSSPGGDTTHVVASPSAGPYQSVTFTLPAGEQFCAVSWDNSGDPNNGHSIVFDGSIDPTAPVTISAPAGQTVSHYIVLASNLNVPRSDLTPPAAPPGISGVAGDGSVTITGLNGSAEPDFQHDDIYPVSQAGVCPVPFQGAAARTRVSSPATSWQATGLTNGQAYTWCVTAVDQTGNESDPVFVSATPASSGGGSTTTTTTTTSSTTPVVTTTTSSTTSTPTVTATTPTTTSTTPVVTTPTVTPHPKLHLQLKVAKRITRRQLKSGVKLTAIVSPSPCHCLLAASLLAGRKAQVATASQKQSHGTYSFILKLRRGMAATVRRVSFLTATVVMTDSLGHRQTFTSRVYLY